LTDLLAATAELVAIPSVSQQETALADHLEAKLRRASWLHVTRVGDNLVARTELGRAQRLVLAGHLDTVPPNGNEGARLEGDVLWGVGSADMKAGLAVMADLALNLPAPSYDLTFVFYTAEEIARQHNGLLAIAAANPALVDDADAAIICEPTGSSVEAGCQGVLKAEVTVYGESAHVARPWTGDNAVHRLAPLIDLIAKWPAREAEIDGCTYRESLQVVGAAGGEAWNVLPASAQLRLSYRFAPDRSVEDATGALRQIVMPVLADRGSLTVVDTAPAAPPALSHPLLAQLVQASGGKVTAKLGWTDAAFFAERGVPAANFGPGDPELAHKADERVTGQSLRQARLVLGNLLAG
jgi:succinyl-diaminopimelate desuccinylase